MQLPRPTMHNTRPYNSTTGETTWRDDAIRLLSEAIVRLSFIRSLFSLYGGIAFLPASRTAPYHGTGLQTAC